MKRKLFKLYLRFQINSKGFPRDRSFWHKAWNLWSLFPPIKLSELSPDEQDEGVILFLLGFACIFLANVMPILIKVSVTYSEYEDQLERNIIQRPPPIQKGRRT